MEMELKIFFMIMKKFCIFPLINIPYYPGSGTKQEKGKYNNIFNIPFPAGTTSEEYLNAYEFVLNKINEFKPEFIYFLQVLMPIKMIHLAQFQLESKIFMNLPKELWSYLNYIVMEK